MKEQQQEFTDDEMNRGYAPHSFGNITSTIPGGR